MAETAWHDAVNLLTPYVVRIWTPQGSGTGFLVSASRNTPLVAVATADHVINHAHYWEEPIRIEHQASGKTVLLRTADRAINTRPTTDTAAIIFPRGDLQFPPDVLPLTPKGDSFLPGVEIGWLGYPAIPRASLCFFSGHISAWVEAEGAYLVDGVAINGVSGGPAFLPQSMLVGVVSAYIPNRATGEPLPGLAVVRGVDHFHELVQSFRSIDEAKAAETPPIAPPPPNPEGETQTKVGR
jgi:hypothetical protein